MNLEDKVLTAIHRIEELYFETNGDCYVSFSGGKDSTVLLALIKMSIDSMVLPPDGITAVFANTGIELDVTYKFIKWCKENWYPNIEEVKPVKSFDWVLKNEGKPMLSKMKSKTLNQWHLREKTEALYCLMINGKTRCGKPAKKNRIADKHMHVLHDDFDIVASYKCCEYMKKKPFQKFEIDKGMKGAITGVRVSEGGARAVSYKTKAKKTGKLCTFTKNNIIYKMPIIDWTDEDIDNFIEKYNVPLSDAYTKFKMQRTGCMACPYSRRISEDLRYLYEYEPNKYKASMHWLKDVYIAQNVMLPFDEKYEKERIAKWHNDYEPMRQEMLRKYRPKSKLIKEYEQIDIFQYNV